MEMDNDMDNDMDIKNDNNIIENGNDMDTLYVNLCQMFEMIDPNWIWNTLNNNRNKDIDYILGKCYQHMGSLNIKDNNRDNDTDYRYTDTNLRKKNFNINNSDDVTIYSNCIFGSSKKVTDNIEESQKLDELRQVFEHKLQSRDNVIKNMQRDIKNLRKEIQTLHGILRNRKNNSQPTYIQNQLSQNRNTGIRNNNNNNNDRSRSRSRSKNTK